MLKIKKITIENFRGIKTPVHIDFYKGGTATSAVIFGRNGTGKSSIVDAWEWLVESEIKYLMKEGISTSDYPHKACLGNDCYINVDFNHATITTARAAFNKNKITAPTTTGHYTEFKALSVYPNYLRYADLQEFVYFSKTEKYKYIARFFGLEKFIKLQADTLASINRIKGTLEQHRNSSENNLRTLSKYIGNQTVNETSVVGFINKISSKHKIAPIQQFKELPSVRKALDDIIKLNPVAAQIAEWISFQSKLNQFYPLTSLKDECVSLETLFKKLKGTETNITKTFLTNLYEVSIQTIGQLPDKNKCPVCDTIFQGDLLAHINHKHKALSTFNKLVKDYDLRKNSVESRFQTVLRKISAIKTESGVHVKPAFKSFFDRINSIESAIPHLVSSVRKPVKDLTTIDISSNITVSFIDKLSQEEAANKRIVTDQIDALKLLDNSNNLATDLSSIVLVSSAFVDHLKSAKKVAYIEGIVTQLESFFSLLTLHIQNQIQSTFTSIQAQVIDYYNALEVDNQFLKNPKINLVTGKDKAVELEIEFVTEKISPAYKFMSESQINSFGLAIFLASVKHFNNQFKFMILDDVVNSFDAFKRPKVAQLLATKFADYQILLLTHDQVFFDTVQRAFPNWQRYKFTSWDYATGPRYRLSKNYVEEIQGFLDEDNPVIAGQTLGRYLEWTFGIANENLQTPIRYKTENVYTLAEFYDPLVKRYKDKLKQNGRIHKLVQAFENFEQATIFRNYCSHWKGEASPFTTLEIQGVFDKWLEIENIIYCTTCKSFVSLDGTGSVEYVRCDCATIDLKDVSYYL